MVAWGTRQSTKTIISALSQQEDLREKEITKRTICWPSWHFLCSVFFGYYSKNKSEKKKQHLAPILSPGTGRFTSLQWNLKEGCVGKCIAWLLFPGFIGHAAHGRSCTWWNAQDRLIVLHRVVLEPTLLPPMTWSGGVTQLLVDPVFREMFHKNSVGELLHESFTIPWTNVANVPQFNISTPPYQQEKERKGHGHYTTFRPAEKKTTPSFWLVIFSWPPSGNTFASHRSSAPTHGLTVPPFTVLKQLSKSFRVTQVRGSKVS